MDKVWKTSEFDYDLPGELIAQYPTPNRSDSRLMCLSPNNAQSIEHTCFNEWVSMLARDDLLVLNDTKVIPARLSGYKSTGGQVECFVERILDDYHLLAQIRASKAPKLGQCIVIADGFSVTIISRDKDLFLLKLNEQTPLLNLIHQFGQVPLPPYLSRPAEPGDQSRYQTIFARKPGAVAAPTAGLHFDEAIMRSLEKKQVRVATLTLHIGAGTFQPVRAATVDQHQMHQEYLEVSSKLCDAVYLCRQRGGRVIAVGTTVVRALETAACSGELHPFTGETNLFIYPGFRFNCVDALLTNFHMPKSSLLMLVCGFAGYECVMKAYREAVINKYRFFSYGDAMFITNNGYQC